MNTRRSLLALPVLAPASSEAFRFETITVEAAEAYDLSACAAPAMHDVLRAELARGLDGRPLPPDLAPRLAELARCPFCGCSVARAADHGEQELRPRG